MDTTEIAALARHLFETQGARAIAEAAHNAARCREAGDGGQAKIWERVEAMVRELRGPHQG